MAIETVCRVRRCVDDGSKLAVGVKFIPEKIVPRGVV